MMNFSHGSGLIPGADPQPATPAFNGQQITEAIDLGFIKTERPHSRERRIGASALGDPCLRKLVYAYTRAPETAPDPRMRRIWDRGHKFEDQLIGWMRQAGFVVIDRGRDGQQLGFSQAKGRIAGRIDGVVMSGPIILPYPVLLEVKCLNNRSWQDLVKHGLATSKEIYNAQLHLYLAYLDIKYGLFCAENADTMELWWLLIPLDMAEAQRASDRGVQVVQMGEAGEIPPRIAASPDYWLCRMCRFVDHCWEK